MWVAKYDKRDTGNILIKYGDRGKDFFILLEGGCDVYIPEPNWEEIKPKEANTDKDQNAVQKSTQKFKEILV